MKANQSHIGVEFILSFLRQNTISRGKMSYGPCTFVTIKLNVYVAFASSSFRRRQNYFCLRGRIQNPHNWLFGRQQILPISHSVGRTDLAKNAAKAKAKAASEHENLFHYVSLLLTRICYRADRHDGRHHGWGVVSVDLQNFQLKSNFNSPRRRNNENPIL